MKEAKKQLIILVFLLTLMWSTAQGIFGTEVQDPALGKYPLEQEYYETLVSLGFLPSKPHLTDIEMAEKLNLDLPQLADVKTALEKKDTAALESALAAYLNTRLPPYKVTPTGKPAPNAEAVDKWLQPEITLGEGDPRGLRTFPLGEKTDWYRGSKDCYGELSQWGIIRSVGDAYAKSGDPKYAEAMIRFVRSFYQTAARPPAQRAKSYMGCYGPWRSLNASGRIMGAYMPATYREIGAASCVTDADRVKFLKIFWEHSDYCYVLLEEHLAHNFEVHVLIGLLEMCATFPEFRDRQGWLDRTALRFYENMRDCVLDDGGLYERTGYHFAVWSGYIRNYRKLKEAGAKIPDAYTKGLEKMTEASMWIMSPMLEHPLFSLGDLNRWTTDMQTASDTFPERSDFAYLSSGGKTGLPPDEVAQVLPYTGWLTMRNNWSREALYMALNFNGNTRSQAGHYDQASFGLWAFGRPYMTNPGTATDYSDPIYLAYIGHTRGSNTVMIDDVTQDKWDNSGRLESWESIPETGPGFTYLLSVNDAYRGLSGHHKRAVLFLRSEPGYWFMHDIISGDGRVHDYRWLGHFQPTELTIDSSMKTIGTAPEDGKRLWLIPAQPDSLSIEQGSGPMVTPFATGAKSPDHYTRAEGPYIALLKKSLNGPATFSVVLYPARDDTCPPVLEPFTVTQGAKTIPPEEAVGYKVKRGINEDILVLAQSSGLRKYDLQKDSIITDGEMAYLRYSKGNLREAGLVGGKHLSIHGKVLIEVSDEIRTVHIRYEEGKLFLEARGNGKIRVLAGKEKTIILNGKAMPARKSGLWWGNWEVDIPNPGPLNITKIEFSTSPEALCKAVGVPLGYGGSYQGPGAENPSVAVTWKTSLPADATLEVEYPYDPFGTPRDRKALLRYVNPEQRTEHKFLLSGLEDGKTYNLRITCRSADGRIGREKEIYKYISPYIQGSFAK